ncbi:MAG: glycosyltransferase family 2 protein [Bacteroidetes bacterium]|nr:glycosyltransferase family 2 protein [Bacteroidota bacterium]
MRFIQYFKNKKFLNVPLSETEQCNISVNNKVPLHILTVAFNNELLLAHQIRLLNKNLKDDFVFIVVDNSSDKKKRKQIKEICLRSKIGYISMPENPFKICSDSHGICLNWIFKNYITVVKPDYFGFIDHDVYPVKSTSLIKMLEEQDVYGHRQGMDDYWFLWPGLSFFKFSKVKDIHLNFLTSALGKRHLDTGGANWKLFFSKLNKEQIIFPSHQYISLREGDVVQSDKMELIGDWLHSFNGSYWMNVKPKENDLFNYLDNL